uniref:DNA/RNA non-specific endonuclease domain-containing protein n=1 Tax=Stegastes partitus TaxID=144197 RepID=A0A3B5ACS7_9TELE
MWRFLLVAAFIVPTATKLVDSVSDCAEFLLQRSPPRIPGILQGGTVQNQNRYEVICQTLRDQKRYVTLYDTENRIPVFSAYKYKGEQDKEEPKTKWKIEPELEERNTNNMREDQYIYQASNKDYKTDARYTRGHLFPVSHAFDRNDKSSTFTLTNIVPQVISFNDGSWQKVESCTKCVLQKYCISNNGDPEGFVVTGARPSTSNTLNNRVNIPSMLWTAFCCYSRNTNRWLASAHWGDNIAEYESKYLQTKTLAQLHQELSSVGSRFEAFPGRQCPLHTTVAEFYPEMDSQCQCPPQASTTTAPPTTTTTSTNTTAPATSKPQNTTIPPTTTATVNTDTTNTSSTPTTTTTATSTTTKKNKRNREEDDDSGPRVKVDDTTVSNFFLKLLGLLLGIDILDDVLDGIQSIDPKVPSASSTTSIPTAINPQPTTT